MRIPVIKIYFFIFASLHFSMILTWERYYTYSTDSLPPADFPKAETTYFTGPWASDGLKASVNVESSFNSRSMIFSKEIYFYLNRLVTLALERATILTAKPLSTRAFAMWKPDFPVAPNSKTKSALFIIKNYIEFRYDWINTKIKNIIRPIKIVCHEINISALL